MIRGFLAAAFLALGTANAQAQDGLSDTPPEAVSIEHFARLPAFSAPALSPDGRHVAFLRLDSGNNLVGVLELDADADVRWFDLGEQKARDVRWASDGAILVTVTATAAMARGIGRQAVEIGGIFHIQIDGGAEPRQLLSDTRLVGWNVSLAEIEAIDWDRGKVFMSAQGRLGRNMNYKDVPRLLFEIDAETGRSRLAERGDGETRSWIFNDEAQAVGRVRADWTGINQKIETRAGGSYRTIRREERREDMVWIAGMAPEGGDFVVEGGRERESLRTIDPATGGETGILLTADNREIRSVRVDPYTNRVVAGLTGEDSRAHWFDDDLAGWEAALSNAVPDTHAHIADWSRDRSVMLVRTSDPRFPADYYIFKPETMSLDFLASGYPELRRVRLPARERFSYRARDGVTIPAFLTVPDQDGPHPLVLLPHGGPASYEQPGYDWMAHGLAARGYAVLQPDFRGSGGYGLQWQFAGHGEWGVGVMQHDLTDGVRALIEEGVADPGRVCIAGASYGGYAALAGAAFTPELYACAVAIAPVSDLADMISRSTRGGGRHAASTRYWREAMGREEGPEKLEAASPARHAEDVQAPVLLMHGEDDTVVPIRQSEIMNRALEQAGKPVRFIRFEGEDHWLSINQSRVATLSEMADFIDAHIGEEAG